MCDNWKVPTQTGDIMGKELERCLICEEPTGRAGRAEDSLYPTLICSYSPFVLRYGDEVGPLCGDCYNAFGRLGFIDID